MDQKLEKTEKTLLGSKNQFVLESSSFPCMRVMLVARMCSIVMMDSFSRVFAVLNGTIGMALVVGVTY